MLLNGNTVILTVHNKEKTIERILNGIIKNCSSFTKAIIVIDDGSSDDSKFIIKGLISKYRNISYIYTDDIWETKANNVGLKRVLTKYVTIIQDDMLIKEKNWDLALKSAFKKNIFSVTGRSIHGFILMNNLVISDHVFGREYPLGNTHLVGRAIAKMFKTFNLFFIYKFWKPVSYGLCANRGPLMLDYSIFKKIGFFDEKFAPFELDDLDLSCRVFKKFGLISASKPTFYQEINGSKKSNSNSAKMSQKAYIKNSKIIKKRHSSLAII